MLTTAGGSGLVVTRLPAAREIPGSNRAADKKFSRKSLWYAALGMGCTLTAVPRSTQPSTLRGTVNEYQPYGWVTNEHVYFAQKTAERQTERQKKAVYICKLQANYNTQRTNDHKNWS